MKIAILYGQVLEGAKQDEQDTLVQVETISHSLTQLGIETTIVPLSLDLQEASERLQTMSPDLVFNLVESVAGWGRLIHLGPALLDLLQLPYTGSKTEALFLTSNKLLAKKLLRSAGIRTPDWFSLQNLQQQDGPIREGYYIFKSLWEHASIGLSEGSVIHAGSASELREALEIRQATLGGEGFVECYIDGREFNLSLLAGNDGLEVLPPAEIRFDQYPQGKLRIVDYSAKWDDGSFEYHHTPRNFTFFSEDGALLSRLKSIAHSCWHLFELHGYARVDFRVDQTGTPYVLEVNANPCLSPDAGFIAAATQAGLNMNQVITRIIKDI